MTDYKQQHAYQLPLISQSPWSINIIYLPTSERKIESALYIVWEIIACACFWKDNTTLLIHCLQLSCI